MKVKEITEEQVMNEIYQFYNKIKSIIKEEFQLLNNTNLLEINFDKDFISCNDKDFITYDKNINKFKLSLSSIIKQYQNFTTKPKVNVNAINRYENDFYNHFTLDDQASIIYLKQVPIEDLIKSEFLYAYLSKIIDIEDTKTITYQDILGLNIEKRGIFWNPILVETESRRISKKYNIFYLPKTIGYKEIFMITLRQLNNTESRNLILNNKMEFILSNLSILVSRKLLLYEENCFEKKYHLKENTIKENRKKILTQVPILYQKQELVEELKNLKTRLLNQKSFPRLFKYSIYFTNYSYHWCFTSNIDIIFYRNKGGKNMQEKDAARILKELISNTQSKLEAFEETEEYKALDEEIDKIVIKKSRTEEEQKKLDALFQEQEKWGNKIVQDVISSLKTQDMEEIISFINSNFLQENKIEFNGWDPCPYILQSMIQEIIKTNPDYANQLLQNESFMDSIYSKNNLRLIEAVFENVTDEDLLEEEVLKETKNPRNRIISSEENSIMHHNLLEDIIRAIAESKKISKKFKLYLLEKEDVSLYLSGYTIKEAINSIGELTPSDRQQLLNNFTILTQLPGMHYTQIIASSCATLEDYENALQDERVDIRYLLQGNHLSREELETLLFRNDRYEKIDSLTLTDIIISANLSFEDRKKLLFNEKLFSKLNDINITTIFISKAFTKEDRESLFKDQRIATAIYDPEIFSNNIGLITEAYNYNNNLTPEEKLAILTDKRIIEGLSSITIEKFLADPKVSTDMATEVLFNKNLFYRLIKEYHPEYNPTGSKKGPFKYDKYEYIKLLYQKNPNIAKTLCIDLLDDKILDLGFDLIEKISKYHSLGTSVSIAYNGFGKSESFVFEHILQTLNETKNANEMMIEALIPKILTIASDNSYYYEDPKKRTKYSTIRSEGKLDLDALTKKDWKTLSYIGLRDQSNYYNGIEMTIVGEIKDEIDITLNILPSVVTNDNLKDYEKRRQALCDTYFTKALEDKDLKQAQNAYLNKYYSINIEEARAIVSMYSGSIESLSKNEKYNLQTSYILGIMEALNTTSLQGLQEIYQDKKVISFDEYVYIDQAIRQMFSEEMSESVYKVTDKIVDEYGNLIENKSQMMSFTIEENGITTTKQVPVYEPGFDFKMLIHSTAAYGEMELLNNNYFDSWNKSLRTSNHGICCSLISNDNLGMANVNDVLLGFDGWDKKAISQSSPYDLHTYNDGYNIQEGHAMVFLTPQDIIDTTRHTHNEQTLERIELRPERKTREYPNIQPSYVIIYSDMKDEIKAKAVKCSEDMNIPIVYLDKEKNCCS